MKRQEKYKDTDTFHFHNQNPKGKYTTDCVIRAISLATDIPYNQVVMELAAMQCETGLDEAERRLYGKYLESKGFVTHKQPKHEDGKKYTGKGFCLMLTENLQNYSGKVVANIGGHHIVAIAPVKQKGRKTRYKVHDTWDSTKGCIGAYWTKP